MKKQVLYQYLGTNGTILSPIHLEDVYYIRKLRLSADKNKRLTKDNVNFVKSVIIPEEEESEWKELS